MMCASHGLTFHADSCQGTLCLTTLYLPEMFLLASTMSSQAEAQVPWVIVGTMALSQVVTQVDWQGHHLEAWWKHVIDLRRPQGPLQCKPDTVIAADLGRRLVDGVIGRDQAPAFPALHQLAPALALHLQPPSMQCSRVVPSPRSTCFMAQPSLVSIYSCGNAGKRGLQI